ncbi:hypothetical protein [Gallibacterium genomosp. 1]|uniref:hypothetical protein n=1 Tax=Gallibacterium genomosp. 1 TaxID=155515 RepID=UPI0018D36113|nr:hypothetical protein [Gallibacterium genomosp. 1]
MTQAKLHKAIRDRGLPLTTATRKFSMNMLIDSYMRNKGFIPHNGHGYVRVDEVDQSVVTNKYSFIYHEHVYGYSDHDLHGFGVNAVSSIREHTITNTSSRQNYINSMMNGKIPMTINKHSKILDEMKALIMRLPYHGEVEKSKIDMINIPLSLQEKISQLKNYKLITEDKERFYLTKLGWYWYTNIMFWLMPESEQIAMKHFVAKHLNTEGKFIAKKELIYV